MASKSLEKCFGKVLRELRRERKLSQERLAELTDLHPTFISRMENGHKQPTITTVFRLAKALDTLPEELIKAVREDYVDFPSEAK